MNSKNSKSSKPHVLMLKLSYNMDLQGGGKSIALSNLSIYYTWESMKSSYNSNEFKISVPTWNDKFKLPNESYSVSDIQDYFEYIIKKYETITDNPPIRIYVNKIENRITFKIKTGYYVELLTPETMKLLGSTENKISKDRNVEDAPHLEITEVVLVHCNVVNNHYQKDSRILYTFVPNKSFGNLLEIALTNFIFLKAFNSKFQDNEVWLTDQNSQSLEIQDEINLTLVIK